MQASVGVFMLSKLCNLVLSMEAKGKTRSKREGKFRSCGRKKRKGFQGKKAWKCEGKQRKMAEITPS